MFDWSKKKLKEHAIRILKAGSTQKYLLTNRSELKLNMMYTTATNECKWVVNVRDITEESYIIELFTLENIITDTNNEMVHEMAAFKNIFREVYDELVLEISFYGELIAVKNIKLLQQKWHRVREDLSKMLKQYPQAGTVITLNDELFNSHVNVRAIIGAMEFFELFFPGFYGKELPGNADIIRNNRLKATPLKWYFSFGYPTSAHYYATNIPLQVDLTGSIAERLSIDKIEEKYGKFDFITAKNLQPDFRADGKFFINRKTGLIEEAQYNHYEILDKDLLYTINKYHLKAYE